jgi:uncharacterized protein (TIGR03435 family)
MTRVLSRTGTAALVGVLLGIGVARVRAQDPAAAGKTFEVASVKQNKSGAPFIRFGSAPGGRLNADNVPVRELIRFAYALQNFQMIGGPAWINDERFDIVAKAPEGTPPSGPPAPGMPSPQQLMLQNLLAERFKLKAHRETRDMPIYALLLARPDGKLGPKIEVSTTDCAARAAARGRGAGGGPPAAPPIPAPGERPPCGMFMGPASIAAGDVGMKQLAQSLSPRVGRIVIDKTGLTGNYSFNLDFTPDPAQIPQGPPPPGVQVPAFDPNGPSLYTALQEQLGLKLDSQRGPVEVLVIDSVEHPMED